MSNSDAVSLFTLVAESVGANRQQKMEAWLNNKQAQPEEKNKLRYTNLPWDPSQQTHSFSWQKSHVGWMDVLRSDGQVVQVVFNLRYPKRRWFSRHRKDWKSLNETACRLMGEGKLFGLPERPSQLYRRGKLNLLMKSYEEKRHAYIELKLAKGEFCS